MRNTRSSNHYAGHILSLIAGALFPLGFSPYEFWPVLILATSVGFYLCRTASPRVAAIRGFLFGMGIFGAGTSWVYVSIHEFGSAPPALAGLLTLLFVLLLTTLFVMPVFALYARLRDRFKIFRPWRQALLFCALWILFEWTRSWLLTGFPWLLQGYALLDTPFQSWAPVVGVYGLSLLMVATASLLTALITSSSRERLPAIAGLVIMAAAWAIAIPLSSIQWTEAKDKLTFSAIQGNIPQSLKWEPGHLQQTLSTYFGLTWKEWEQDLVIWPENAIPIVYSGARSAINQLDREASANGTAMILGIPYDEFSNGETRYYNSIVALGQNDGRYYKNKLVPFGEYVPLESLLRGTIAFFDLPMSSFSRGPKDQSLLEVAGSVIAPYICYEVVYPDFAAKQARTSDLLVTLSNDTWFGTSIGPLQHFQMARMRAVETGRYMIRATNDGISALIDDKGKVLKTIPRFEKGVLRGTAQTMTGNTPFMLLGSWPVLLVAALMLLVACRNRRS